MPPARQRASPRRPGARRPSTRRRSCRCRCARTTRRLRRASSLCCRRKATPRGSRGSRTGGSPASASGGSGLLCNWFMVLCVLLMCLRVYVVLLDVALLLICYVYVKQLYCLCVCLCGRPRSRCRRRSARRAWSRATAPAPLGWHYLSNTTCLMRPHSCYACFVVSGSTHNVLRSSPPSKKNMR